MKVKKYRVKFLYSVLYHTRQFQAGEEAEIFENDYQNLKNIVQVIEEKEEEFKVENQEEKMKEKQKQK